jgi:hypothetical protein
MSPQGSKTASGNAGRWIERISDRVGVFLLLALGLATAGATLFVGA